MTNVLKISIVVKIFLVLILLCCLFSMPYGYYQFVRIASFVLFGYLAYSEIVAKRISFVLLYLILALLFNPIVKVILERHIWHIIDSILALLLIGTMVFDKLNQNNKFFK
ncbi:MAG: hypothetical protein A3F91_10200 [Flavobacteria bacterium RIFCSPLOWO2_12_FULL_35_11]|nr:MAG: hypothetical protein A3F91_10200 [Flavobacteria bacterium RIFCSPLOWO2_12_FULL_35_11]